MLSPDPRRGRCRPATSWSVPYASPLGPAGHPFPILTLDVLNMSVRTREEQALVTTVGPSHQVRAAAACSSLQDFAVSNRPVQRARGHHDPIADLRLHRVLLSVSVNRAVRATGTPVISPPAAV